MPAFYRLVLIVFLVFLVFIVLFAAIQVLPVLRRTTFTCQSCEPAFSILVTGSVVVIVIVQLVIFIVFAFVVVFLVADLNTHVTIVSAVDPLTLPPALARRCAHVDALIFGTVAALFLAFPRPPVIFLAKRVVASMIPPPSIATAAQKYTIICWAAVPVETTTAAIPIIIASPICSPISVSISIARVTFVFMILFLLVIITIVLLFLFVVVVIEITLRAFRRAVAARRNMVEAALGPSL